MRVSDKKALVRKYFEEFDSKKAKKVADKRHLQLRASDNLEKIEIFENRKKSLLVHEEEGILKKAARQKEVDKRQTFLKLSSALNII